MSKIVSFDPGKINFAYALRENDKILSYGFLNHCITDLSKFSSQSIKLKWEILDLLKKWKLDPKTDHCIAERFMVRPGRSKGCVAEFVNLQLGLIAAWIVPIELKLVTASTWKNYIKRKYGTNDMLKVTKKLGMKEMIVHEADAIGIGIWNYDKSLI